MACLLVLWGEAGSEPARDERVGLFRFLFFRFLFRFRSQDFRYGFMGW